MCDLRVLAISAPEKELMHSNSNALSSADPVSLQNACRYAALLANEKQGAWGNSNWADIKNRDSSVLYINSWEYGKEILSSRLKKVKPNLLLIGAMTICLPGAIRCAQLAKDILGDSVCIVLGGRHSSETIYYSKKSFMVSHHISSPLRLMKTGHIDEVFDVVISGDGEMIVAKIGEIVSSTNGGNITKKVYDYFKTHEDSIKQTAGNWIAGWLFDKKICHIISTGNKIEYNKLPSPISMFGVKDSIKIINNSPTAHVSSDTGGGCIHDCFFCSERSSVSNPLSQKVKSPYRLHQQLADAYKIIVHEQGCSYASAFVEDSTFLGGSIKLIKDFISLMEEFPLNINYGIQLTIDQILQLKSYIPILRSVGLRYVFIGIETTSLSIAKKMNKNIRTNQQNWHIKIIKVLEILSQMNIKIGSSLLLGLGETQQDRLELLENINNWIATYGNPTVLSANWAVQHPLRGRDNGANYKYTEWAIPRGPFLDAFKDFGEASVRYPLFGQSQPVLNEVQEFSNQLSLIQKSHNLNY